jgi:hypothetical protein
VDRSKQEKPKAPEKEYKGAPGVYSGSIGGEPGQVTVPESGVYSTSDPDEQTFLDGIGWVGKVVEKSGSARSGAAKKE